MAAVGTNMLTSLVRHYIVPKVFDNAYLNNNALLNRLIRGGKRVIQGGTQIEVPLQYKQLAVGGSYSGLQLLDVQLEDTVQNGFVDWKQYYTTIAIDGRTLNIADSPLAIANVLRIRGQEAYMKMGELLAGGIFNDPSAAGGDTLGIDGFPRIIDDGNTYAGIDRSTETWWQATVDSATTALTFTAMRSLFSDATVGASHPTIWFGNANNYNALYALNTSTTGYSVQHQRQPGGHDEVLAQAGFTNLIFENVPFVRDDNMADTDVYALNENFFELAVSHRSDFYMSPFIESGNQDGYTAKLLWMGNIYAGNSKTQAAFTALAP